MPKNVALHPNHKVRDWRTRLPSIYAGLLDEDGKIDLARLAVTKLPRCWWVGEWSGVRSTAATVASPFFLDQNEELDHRVKVVQTWERLARLGYLATPRLNYEAWKSYRTEAAVAA